MMDNYEYEECFGGLKVAAPRSWYQDHSDDTEATSNMKLRGNDHDTLSEVPVYDTDDGVYHEVDLDDDDTEMDSTLLPTDSTTDPQLILIQNKSVRKTKQRKAATHDSDEDSERPPGSCWSSLCFRFL